MKNSIYFLFTLVFLFVSCSQEEEMVDTTLTLTSEADSALKAKTGKVNVCHYDADTDTWKTLNINGNALKAHLNHGDVSLVDADGDGYVEAVNECVPGGDCDDTNADINPGIEEIPYNGLDDDCDPATLEDDLDEDGFLSADDCDDTNADINPEIEEIPYNGLDDDCDPETLDDDLDEDGFLNVDDCDDTNAEVNPEMIEICGNEFDENCDGIVEECNLSPIYLDGSTIKCYDWANVGDTGEISGITYTIVDETILRQMCDDLGNRGALEKVCTTKVTDMSRLFMSANLTYHDISSWDVSNVTDMNWMFVMAGGFNGYLSNWDVSSVTDMNNMFAYSGIKGGLSNWDVSSVTNMSAMFSRAWVFNGYLSNWDVSSVTTMRSMFDHAYEFKGGLSNWDVSNVTSMSKMFQYTRCNQDLSNWDVTSVTYCADFSMGSIDWKLPKPTFTNCTE